MYTQLNHIDWNQITELIANFCTCDSAKEAARNIKALNSPQEAEKSFETIYLAQDVMRLQERIELTSLNHFHQWFHRLEKSATLSSQELLYVRNFMADGYYFKQSIIEVENQWTREILEGLMEFEVPLDKIEAIITDDGDIRTDASPLLQKLFNERKSLKNEIHSLLDKLVKTHELEGILQDRYVTTREGRWVLPIKNGMQSRFEGIVHDSSQSKQTVFVEPQGVVKNNNRIREIDMEIQSEIERILKQISYFLTSLKEDIRSNFQLLLDCDLILAKAKLGLKTNANKCKFNNSKFYLPILRNPLLIFNTEVKEVIANNFAIPEDKLSIILSGPNAGGKTILLKSVGLAAHMARCGLLVCSTEEATLPFFNEIFVSVGDSQNIKEGLSTFAGHMKELSEAADSEIPLALVLVDEICGSTDPEEGAALARAFVKYYCRKNYFSVITSHLGALKQSWKEEEAVINASMEFDDYSGMPSYQLILGVAGSSFAWKTAKRIGVSQEILDDALNYLSKETQARNKGLDQIEEAKQHLLKAQKQAQFELEQANEQKQKYQKMIDRFKIDKDKLLQKSVRKAERQLDDMLEQARLGNNKKSAFDIRADLPTLVKSKKDIQITNAEEFKERYPSGTQVWASNLQMNAIIQSEPNNKGEVEVLANSMKISVHWKYLNSVDRSKNQVIQKNNKKFQFSSEKIIRSTDPTIDVRGKTTEEAISQIEDLLDSFTLNGDDRVKIIHGHGTGSLKKSIRNYLSRSPYVEKWHAAKEEQGGDGATWAYLK